MFNEEKPHEFSYNGSDDTIVDQFIQDRSTPNSNVKLEMRPSISFSSVLYDWKNEDVSEIVSSSSEDEGENDDFSKESATSPDFQGSDDHQAAAYHDYQHYEFPLNEGTQPLISREGMRKQRTSNYRDAALDRLRKNNDQV